MSEGIKAVFVSELTVNELVPSEVLGTIRLEPQGAAYKYIKYNDGTGTVVAAASKGCAYHGDNGYDDNEVTCDYSDGTVFAGAMMAAVTTAQHGWVQIRGKVTMSVGLDAGADGNAYTIVGATDGTLDVSALVTDHIVAVGIDDSADKVLLTGCPF